ncbi:MAG TPA: potassium transporter TrkA [Actinoplanes sp.]|nr:potassium transporter TrkA [Actinoplanes sp.]
MIIERADLPGIGTGFVAATARDRRIGVVVHRTGRRDLVVYDPEDPDRVAITVTLDAAEAECVAHLLTGTTVVERPPLPARTPARRWGPPRTRSRTRPATG